MGRADAETAEEVAARIRAGLRHIAADRLIPAPDCGMKFLPRAVAFAKLKALADGAAIVRRELRETRVRRRAEKRSAFRRLSRRTEAGGWRFAYPPYRTPTPAINPARSRSSACPSLTTCPSAQRSIRTVPDHVAATGISAFIDSRTSNACPIAHAIARLHQHFPHAAGHRAGHGVAVAAAGISAGAACKSCGSPIRRPAASQRARSASNAACWPALNARDAVGVRGQERAVVAQAKHVLLDLQPAPPVRKVVAEAQQRLGGDRVEADLVEEAQQPGLAGLEVAASSR